MKKRKDAEANFDIVKHNNRVQMVSTSSRLIQEQLKQIERIREINGENRSLHQEVKKAEKELEEYKAEVKTKQLQLHQLTDQNNRYKLAIRGRNDKIQKLLTAIEKRDKIFDFCHNNNGEDNQEVYLDFSNGHKIFEFRNKQTIPYTIKTERLSPVSHEESSFDIEIELAPIPKVEYCDSDSESDESKSRSSEAEEGERSSEVEEGEISSESEEGERDSFTFQLCKDNSPPELNQDIAKIQQHDTPTDFDTLNQDFDDLPVQKEVEENNKEITPSPAAKLDTISNQPIEDESYLSSCPSQEPKNQIHEQEEEEEAETQVQSDSHQDELLLSQQHPDQQEQQQELSGDAYYSQYYQYYQNYQNYYAQWQNYAYYYGFQQQQQQYQNQPTYFQPPPLPQSQDSISITPIEVLSTDEDLNPDPDDNVLNMPKILRYNFAISDDSELSICPIALQFWFDPAHYETTKYFIKFHDDSDRSWRTNKYFVLVEQIGLRHPSFHLLKYNELLEKVEKTTNKRIWLDCRNFNSLFQGMDEQNSIFSKAETFSSITHFSFGHRVIKSSECASYFSDSTSTSTSTGCGVKWRTLLKFISGRLNNLEYLSVNNSMLSSDGSFKKNTKSQILQSIKTIRLIHGTFKFPVDFISSLLKMCPNLQNLFGLPLNFLEGGGGNRKRNDVVDLRVVRSFFVNKEYYYTKDGPLTYIGHLSILSGQNFWNSLEELDCRTLFLPGDQSTLDICYHWLSEILSHHHNSLKVLKLQPISSSSSSLLIIPRLENLTTFKFYLSSKLDHSLSFFFSNGSGSGFHPLKFPNLTTVEIILEFGTKAGNKPTQQLFLQHFPRNVFQPGISFTSVTDLTLHGFNVVDCMKDMSELFQNLQILRLHDVLPKICEVLPSCFNLWPALKQLHLNVDTNTSIPLGNLDSVLLGTTAEHCQFLCKKSPEVQQREIDKLSDSSPIYQLKELQLFKIILRSTGNEKTEKQLPIMTELSARILSKFGSQLKVQIAFQEKMSSTEKNRLIATLLPLRSFPCLAHTYSIET